MPRPGDLTLLVGWAVAATAATGAGLVRAGALGTLGPSWTLSFVVTCAVGTWACVAQPGNRAAVRLLVSGCAALTWLAGSVWLLAAVADGADGGGFVAANAGAQLLGLAAVAAQAAALVRYPDGVPHLAAERRLVTVLAAVAVAVPAVLLLSVDHVVPTWVLEWSSRSDGLVLPTVDSPAYVPALSEFGPVAEGVYEAALGLGPLAAAVVAAVRYRRLGPADRRRMAWPLVALLVLLVGLTVNALADAGALPGVAADSVAIACHVLLPVALGVGIAAPSLFDALGAVRRTVPFAVLAAARPRRLRRRRRPAGHHAGRLGPPGRRRGRRARGARAGPGAPQPGAAGRPAGLRRGGPPRRAAAAAGRHAGAHPRPPGAGRVDRRHGPGGAGRPVAAAGGRRRSGRARSAGRCTTARPPVLDLPPAARAA